MSVRESAEIRLGRLELQIMNVVWQKGTATVHEVRDALKSAKTPAYSTILTMMRSLENKGYLEHTVKDRTYVYRATIAQQDVRCNVLGDVMSRLFDGSPSLLVNSLLAQKNISDADIKQIKKLIKERDEK